MKTKFYLLFFLIQLTTISTYSQIYNPTFSSRSVSYLDITKIDRLKSSTVVHFKYKAPDKYVSGGWICAGKDFFIRDFETRKKYKLLQMKKIPMCPNKYYFKDKGEVLEFELVFEALPSDTKLINIIESETESGFNFYVVDVSTSIINENKVTLPKSTNISDWKSYFRNIERKIFPVEGIYEASYHLKVINYFKYEKVVGERDYGPATIAVFKDGNQFNVKILNTFHVGNEVEGIDLSKFAEFSFRPTASNSILLGEIDYQYSKYSKDFKVYYNDGIIKFDYLVPKGFTIRKNSVNDTHKEYISQEWVKIFPTVFDKN